jgi:hypothetical protein
MRKPVLIVTAYFVDAVETRLAQDFELRRKKNGAPTNQDSAEQTPSQCCADPSRAPRLSGVGRATRTEKFSGEICVSSTRTTLKL